MIRPAILATWLLAAPGAAAGVIEVPADQPTVQAAIDAAADGDEIVVATGTYVETISLSGKAVTLRSTDPADPDVVAATVIDAGGAGTVVTCERGEGPATIIAGLTIANGAATFGGGIACDGASPTIDRCVITGNDATIFGGGVHAGFGSPTITACVITGNTAASGGGVYLLDSEAIIDDALVSGNLSTGSGGGVFVDGGSPTIVASIVRENTAGGAGGGLEIFNGENVGVRACTFAANEAGSVGGGVLVDGGSALIVNCVIRDNAATSGGGVHGAFAATGISNCTFVGNTAVGPGGIAATGPGPIVANCIAWSNSAPQIAPAMTDRVTFSLVEGGFAGQGNVDADPLLDEDLRPASGSPALDAGHNWAVPAGVTDDRDGLGRFASGGGAASGCGAPVVVDLGAFERRDGPAFDLRPGDVDGDGAVGVPDLIAVIVAWGGCPPDTCCLADLDRSGVVDVADLVAIVTGWGRSP